MSADHPDPGATLMALGFEPAPASPFRDEVVRLDANTVRLVAVRPSMTTRVSVTALGRSAYHVQEVVGRAFQEMDRVVALLNRHAGDSAVSHLNVEGSLPGAPPELLDVLAEARRLHAASRGVFDVTVAPLVAFARTSSGPAPQDVLDLVDMGTLSVDGRRVRLGKTGMGVTLDGIAKGYVVDRMAAALQAGGLARWLIDAGGDIRASGRREDGAPWRVGVRDPNGRGGFPEVTEVTHGALATSGTYERPRHIVFTGERPSKVCIASATVRAPTTMMADALATAAFALGPGALGFIDAIPGSSCLLLDDHGRRFASGRWLTPDRTDP